MQKRAPTGISTVFPLSFARKLEGGTRFAASLDFKRPHRSVDTDLPVGNVEETLISPCGIPTVFADPEALDVIIANATDAMTALQSAANMVVNATVVTEEIRIHAEAGD